MEVSAANIQRSIRLANYSEEKTSIQRKLENPQVPDGKKERLGFRLRDLDNRLIPKTMGETN